LAFRAFASGIAAATCGSSTAGTDRVRIVRGDGRGEHVVEVLPDDRIRVDLPIGVTAVCRRVGS
jgi:hypothetical protein